MTSPRYADAVEQRAAELLPEPVHRYVRQGARDGTTAAEASAAWDRFRFLPQVLRDVTRVDLRTSVLGTPLRLAVRRRAHRDAAGRAPRRARRRWAAGSPGADSLMVVSSNAGSTFEDIAATGVAWWSQVYVTADRSACLPLVERAVAAGARALVLTADTPVVGTKYDGKGPTVWDLLEPGWLQSNFPPGYGDAAGRRQGHRPRPAGRRVAGPGQRSAGGGQGRAARRRRPPLRRCRRGRRVGVQPRRSPARPGRRHRGPCLGRRGRGGRATPARCTSTGECAPDGTRSPLSPWAPGPCSWADHRSMHSPPTAPTG